MSYEWKNEIFEHKAFISIQLSKEGAMKLSLYVSKFFAWVRGVVLIPVTQKKEIRGNGGKTQREIIKRWWN